MVVDWTSASPFLIHLERLLNQILVQYGRRVSISLGDIWPALKKSYPEGSSIETNCLEFRHFVKCRVLDRVRSDLRQTKRFGIPSDFGGDEPTSGSRDPAHELIQAEQAACLETSLNLLPEADRDLILALFEKRSPKPAEMAQSLGVSRRTIKRREHDACNRLRWMLKSSEHIGGGL